MRPPRLRAIVIVLLAIIPALAAPGAAREDGLRTIRADDMRFPLRFLSAPELRGRNTPSEGLNAAARYLALSAEALGLAPLLPSGSYFQEFDVEVRSISPVRSWLRLHDERGERRFFFPQSFGTTRSAVAATVSGEIIFLGLGLSSAHLQWDDIGQAVVKNKVAVILDEPLPKEHPLKPEQNRAALLARSAELRRRGAAAVVRILGREREAERSAQGQAFDPVIRLDFPGMDVEETRRTSAPPAKPAVPPGPFQEVEVRREVGSVILGIDPEELDRLSDDLTKGKQVSRRELPDSLLEISLAFDKKLEKTRNVAAVVEGRHPVLKKEYVVLTAHYDHVGVQEGKVRPGSDDNASGSVALLEVAEAVRAERPKRSVIFVWLTAEEKGLVGAYHFVTHPPVPLERIQSVFNLDMVSRGEPGRAYLVGSSSLSSEFDATLHRAVRRAPGLTLDDSFQSPSHPQRFFFRSDHYPFIRCGIPAVVVSGGDHPDYHQAGDTADKADFRKMEGIARLVYAAVIEAADRPSLFKLDVNAEVTRRGAHNMKHDWRRPADKPAPKTS